MFKYYLIEIEWQGDDQRTIVRTDENDGSPHVYNYAAKAWKEAFDLWSRALFRGSYAYRRIDEDEVDAIFAKHGGSR